MEFADVPDAQVMFRGAAKYFLDFHTKSLDEIDNAEIRETVRKFQCCQVTEDEAIAYLREKHSDEILGWLDFNHQIDTMLQNSKKRSATDIQKMGSDETNKLRRKPKKK